MNRSEQTPVRDGEPCTPGDWLRTEWNHIGLYIQALVKWLAVAAVTGAVCGAVGSAFHIGVEKATELRGANPWLLWCLPLAGLVIVGFYKLTKTEGQGTNDIIDAVHLGNGPFHFAAASHFPGHRAHPPLRRLRGTGRGRTPDGRHHRSSGGSAVPSG